MEMTDIVGWAAIGLSSCFYLSLAVPFFKVLRCKLNFEYTPIALVNTIYVDCVSWYIYGTKLNALILILGTLVLHKGLSMVIEDAQMVGKICIGTKLITFCIPALMVFRVFKEKNYGLISLNNTIICCAACSAWCLFGKCTNDMNAMCANGIAVLLCLAQICVYFSFKNKYAYSGPTSTIGIDQPTTEEIKKEENSSINIDDETQEKTKEKPVRIVTKIDS